MAGDVSALAAAALGIALSPLALVLALALLGTSRPIRNASAFLSGQAFAVAAVAGLAVFVLADEHGVRGWYATALDALDLVVGALLAGLLVVHLRRARDDAEPRRWPDALEHVAPRWAFAGGVAMIAANPKNLALTLAGAAAIVRLGYTSGGQAATIVTFTAAAVSALVLLLAVAIALPARSAAVVVRIESVVDAHERVLVGAVLGVLATYFLVHAILSSLT